MSLNLPILQPPKEKVKRPSVVFATVTSGPLEYEFTLGSLRHHAKIADKHVVLDVSPEEHRREFKGLPSNVIWVYEDKYRSCTKMFAFRLALLRVIELAKQTGCEIIAQVDSDEFFTPDVKDELFPFVKEKCVELAIVTWCSDGHARYKPNSWVRRVWDLSLPVTIPQNKGWQRHVHYNGNPERNPIPIWPMGIRSVKVTKPFLHHVHWTFPQKGLHPFSEWPILPQIPQMDDFRSWPLPLKLWRTDGIPPSKAFE